MAKDKKEKKEKLVPVKLSQDEQERANQRKVFLASLRKEFGESAAFMGHEKLHIPMKVISTGSLILDGTSGIGGIPRGRIVEIWGPEASGKTTLALSLLAQAQKAGLNCGYIDAEHALDLQYAKKLGVKTEELIFSQPDSAEEALDIYNAMAASGAIQLIVLDSVAALVPKAELEGEMGDQSMGVVARMMSKILRKVTPTVSKNEVIAIFINQIRMKIGVMFGSPETTTGGNALKFYASMRLSVRKGDVIGEKEKPRGHMMNIKFVKNKMASPFRECEVPLIYGQGVDEVGEMFALGKQFEVLEVRGGHTSWTDANGEKRKLGSSRDETIETISKEPLLKAAISQKIREEMARVEAGGEIGTEGTPEPDEQGEEPKEE